MDQRRWPRRCFLLVTICLVHGHFSGGSTVSSPTEEDSNGVEITRLAVPHSIENGTVEFADLDCEYTLRDNLTELLDVSWYHRDSEFEKIVYQWIPDHKIRKAYNVLENRLDTTYTVSTVPWEKYRSIRILKPTTEISGHYRCAVSTKHGYKSEESLLIVYSKPKEYDLEVIQGQDDGSVNISCWASRTYPQAKLTVSFEEQDKNRVKLSDMNEESAQVSGGYDVRVFNSIDPSTLPSSSKISCDIRIPNTGYLERREVNYEGRRSNATEDDSSSSSSFSAGRGLLLVVILKLLDYFCFKN